MPAVSNPSRRKVILIIAFSAILSIIFVTSFRGHAHSASYQQDSWQPKTDPLASQHDDALSEPALIGHAIAPKLGNETIKAELGRASWKLFHTVMARFPEAPTADEKADVEIVHPSLSALVSVRRMRRALWRDSEEVSTTSIDEVCRGWLGVSRP